MDKFIVKMMTVINDTEAELEVLSDQTRIAKTTWAKLKQDAMSGNNEEKDWFVSILLSYLNANSRL